MTKILGKTTQIEVINTIDTHYIQTDHTEKHNNYTQQHRDQNNQRLKATKQKMTTNSFKITTKRG